MEPPITSNGQADLRFFAPDCFHFSKFGHSNMGKHLWNTIVQPVGAKQTSVNFTDILAPLSCPEKVACPLFPTTKNSRNCTMYLTPSELD
ncbi:unnamed protein product [Heligmosomoides polygyrus]|uniref:GDSL esterase/lipase n=1 Tax=Heligmosomoides polygyrus TaxID=6339 RepID=A0A183FBB7_HELPZ|nr:unnamed protein product [Heligmosomoides polygyrus]